MPLRDRAILEIDLEDRTGVFELHGELSDSTEINRNFLIGNRGQRFRDFAEIGSDLLPEDVEEIADLLPDRAGYYVDGGSGVWSRTLSFEVGKGDDGPWGDESADEGEYNEYDATGSDVDPMAKKDVLERYLAMARTGSSGQARLYWGEWTTGRYADEAGFYDEPMVVVIPEATIETDPDDPSVVTGSITVNRTAVLPDLDLENVVDDLQDTVKKAVDEAAEQITDY